MIDKTNVAICLALDKCIPIYSREERRTNFSLFYSFKFQSQYLQYKTSL